MPDIHGGPSGFGLAFCPHLDAHRRRFGRQSFRWPAFAGDDRWQEWLGVFLEESLRLVNVDHEPFIGITEFTQVLRFLAVAGVGTNPNEARPARPCPLDGIQCDLAFTLKSPLIFRDMRFFTALGILRPALRQIEPCLHQHRRRAATQRAEHPDLAVVDLAQPTIPLPRHSCGFLPFLPKGCFVEQQHRILMTSQQTISIADQLILDPGMIPDRIAHQILKILLIHIVLNLGHLLHVPQWRTDQPAQVARRRTKDRACPTDEVILEPFREFIQPVFQSP